MNSGIELGPGSRFRIQIDGDILAGDFLTVYASHLPVSGAGDQVLSGSVRFSTDHINTRVTPLGWFNLNTLFENFAIENISAQGNWANDGDSLYVHAFVSRSLAEVTHVDTTGFTYKHAAGLGNMIFAINRLGPGASDIAAIKAAVSRVYP